MTQFGRVADRPPASSWGWRIRLLFAYNAGVPEKLCEERCEQRSRTCALEDFGVFHFRSVQTGAKITVLARSPHIPGDTDFILTDDDLHEVIKAIKRQQQNHQSNPASPV
jgi:hypothetical protein